MLRQPRAQDLLVPDCINSRDDDVSISHPLGIDFNCGDSLLPERPLPVLDPHLVVNENVGDNTHSLGLMQHRR